MINQSQNQAMRMINALKSGVIPDIPLDILCIGREKEQKEFSRCLDFITGENGYVKFIAGEYGAGKTLMLHLLKQQAIGQNFIISKMQINKGFNLSSLDSLYYHIMHNLTIHAVDATGTDFENIFNRWLNQLKNNTNRNQASLEIQEVIHALNSFNSSFARAFLTYIRSRIGTDTELSHAAASWIKGEKNIPAALKAKFDVKGEVDKQNSMDFLKAFVHLVKLLGYQGLVVLIDEIELLMNIRSDIRQNCYENLRFIIDACYAGELPRCMFVFCGTEEVFDNPERGIKTYHALHQRLGDAISKSQSVVSDIRQPVMRLGRLSMEQLMALTDRIILYHKEVYAWQPKISNEAIRNWTLLSLSKTKSGIPSVNTRDFITKLIEVLDIMEQNTSHNIFNTELKIVQKNGVDTFINTFSPRTPL